MPKHLQPIVGETPMINQAIERLSGIVAKENILVITNHEQAVGMLAVCSHLLNAEQIISEPEGRDTAAAIGLAMVLIKNKNPNASFAVLPADHVIEPIDTFQDVIKSAFEAAEKETVIVTIGIKPTFASTSYGYIQQGEAVNAYAGHKTYQVKRFVEKPVEAVAEGYINSGDYLWNAGMFIWSVKTLETALANFTPELYTALEKISHAIASKQPIDTILKEQYPSLPKISIDYAVMEKAKNVVCIESTFEWDDVGEWEAIARHYTADAEGNTVNGLAMTLQSHNNIIVNQDGHLTALIGVDDLIVIQTPDATLVCPRSKIKEIKALVQKLQADDQLKKYT